MNIELEQDDILTLREISEFFKSKAQAIRKRQTQKYKSTDEHATIKKRQVSITAPIFFGVELTEMERMQFQIEGIIQRAK